MRTLTVIEFLHFLQRDYHSFGANKKDVQKTTVSKNKRIQNYFESKIPLRDLYVELMMYDSLLTSNKSTEVSRNLLTNKSTIQLKIKNREMAGEVIVPDAVVREISRKCAASQNPGEIIDILQPLIKYSSNFKMTAPRYFKEFNKWPSAIMKYALQDLGTQTPTITEFRNVMRLVECMVEIQAALGSG
jgi:hypothetical protein